MVDIKITENVQKETKHGNSTRILKSKKNLKSVQKFLKNFNEVMNLSKFFLN